MDSMSTLDRLQEEFMRLAREQQPKPARKTVKADERDAELERLRAENAQLRSENVESETLRAEREAHEQALALAQEANDALAKTIGEIENRISDLLGENESLRHTMFTRERESYVKASFLADVTAERDDLLEEKSRRENEVAETSNRLTAKFEEEISHARAQFHEEKNQLEARLQDLTTQFERRFAEETSRLEKQASTYKTQFHRQLAAVANLSRVLKGQSAEIGFLRLREKMMHESLTETTEILHLLKEHNDSMRVRDRQLEEEIQQCREIIANLTSRS